MVYLKNYPRPLGPEPKIYFDNPGEATPDMVETAPGYLEPDPWMCYELLAFDSEFLARLWLKTYFPDVYLEMKTKVIYWPDGPF